MTDQEALWIQQALEGDDNAFGVLVDEYQKPVYGLCYRMLGNARDAEDAAQESFIRAFQHLKRYDPNRAFATWLLSIAAHYCIDRIRKKQLSTISTDVLPTEIIADRKVPNPEQAYRQKEKEAVVQDLINELKPIDRAAIILRYWYECSEIEISEALDLSVSAVKSRLYRARQSLAESWIRTENSTPVTKRSRNGSPAL